MGPKSSKCQPQAPGAKPHGSVWSSAAPWLVLLAWSMVVGLSLHLNIRNTFAFDQSAL